MVIIFIGKLMKKLSLLCFISAGVFAMNNIDDSVIKNASYLVYKKRIDNDGKKHRPNIATFYNYDGNPITTIDGTNSKKYIDLKKKLDPKAPKPQPRTYKITH